MKKFQKTYGVATEIEEIKENLKQAGYNPIPIPSSRNPEIQTDNFTFKFLPNLNINVFAKENRRDVQVSWNSIEELEKYEKGLIDLFMSKGKIKYSIITQGNLDKFIEEVEIAYLKYMRPYRSERYSRKLEKVRKLFSDKRL